MPGKVTLEVIKGQLDVKALTFEEHDTFLVGRAPDSTARLPDDKAVSRRHFLLEANPPDARIRDLGSRNGTFVNGIKYGGRQPGETPEEGGKRTYPEVDLKDGDRLRVGNTELLVRLSADAVCLQCGAAIAEAERERCAWIGATFMCRACRQAAVTTLPKNVRMTCADCGGEIRQGKLVWGGRHEGRNYCQACWEGGHEGMAPARERLAPPPVCCQKCGKDASAEVGPNRRGDYICQACRQDEQNDPMDLLVQALVKAGLATVDEKAPEIAGYSIGDRIGTGQFGAVYLAARERDGARVAVKVMLSRVAVDERSRNRFERGIDLAKGLRHPNIVALLDHGSAGGAFYFVMEYCDAGSIARLMAETGGRLPLAQAGPIMLQALEGLAYAHGSQIVHRDLKPANILLTTTAQGRVAKVSDFGLSKDFQKLGFSGITMSNDVVGMPGFMPPEQVSSFKKVRPSGDVWSMAATFYNMLTGQVPLDFPNDKDPLEVVLDCETVPIRKRLPSVPPRVAEVIGRALAPDAADRYQDAGEFRNALEQVL